jgi:hypothetical protein
MVNMRRREVGGLRGAAGMAADWAGAAEVESAIGRNPEEASFET